MYKGSVLWDFIPLHEYSEDKHAVLRDFYWSILILWDLIIIIIIIFSLRSDRKCMGKKRMKSQSREPKETLHQACLILYNFCLHFLACWKDTKSTRTWLFHHWNENASWHYASWFKAYRTNLKIYYSENYKTDRSPEIVSGEKDWEKSWI